jgi:amidase
MPTVIGILSHSVATLRLVLKSVVSTEPWLRDPYALPIPWKADEERRVQEAPSLSLGYMGHDGIVTPHPPISRALRMVKKALEAGVTMYVAMMQHRFYRY